MRSPCRYLSFPQVDTIPTIKLMQVRINKEPSTDLYGTPDVTSDTLDLIPSKRTCCL